MADTHAIDGHKLTPVCHSSSLRLCWVRGIVALGVQRPDFETV